MAFTGTPSRILLVDDDPQERRDLARILSSLGYIPETAEDGEDALEKLGALPIDAIITDLMMPRMDGYALLKTLLARGDLTPAIVLTGIGSIREAMAIVHDLRAFWFLDKPGQPAILAALLERAIHQKNLIVEAERLQRQLNLHGVLGDLIGASESMQQVFSLIRQVAPKTAPVLIGGESGTGKERVAAAIHRMSRRATGPFVAVNCAAIPESLMESELFGHEKGAFTGAIGRQTGYFEYANGGTVFLDEIAEMSMPLQAKLLRVLEESKVRRIGGQCEVPVDVRVLAATNRPLDELLNGNLLREDLYYRLNVFNIQLPPLRHRKEDIPAISEALIRILNQRNDCRVTHVDAEALAMLMSYSWPGNIRELRNILERAIVVAGEGALSLCHFPPGFNLPRNAPVAISPQQAAPAGLVLEPGRPLQKMEEQYIRLTLAHTNNDRRRTATILGISLRTLYKRLSEFAKADSQPA
jgi:DNA-binding NtrC family response regulator